MDSSTKTISIQTRLTRVEGQMETLAKDVGSVAHSVERVSTDLSGFIQESTRWRERQAEGRKTNWFAVASLAFGFFSVLGGLLAVGWFVIKLQVDSTLSPVKDRVAWMDASFKGVADTSVTANSGLQLLLQSKATADADRADLSTKVYRLQDQVSQLLTLTNSDRVLRAAKETEIETQFRAEDQMRNIQWANNQRITAMLWEKVFNSRFPSDVYFFPNIASPSQSPSSIK